jgi:mannose-1-phosphate guanylyltransferase
MSNRYIAIMAGGIGSRFWPSSTQERPKQFLDILDTGSSLIQMTYERSKLVVPAENIIVVTNHEYKKLVQEHLPDLPRRNILCEPSRNNTAPSVAYTALHLLAKNIDATFAMLPTDEVIQKETAFVNYLEEAFTFAEAKEAIVTLGIKAIRPDTGYGYIETNVKDEESVKKVIAFKEKPDKDTAQHYLHSGNYVWNAGIFIWNVKTVIKAYEKNAPNILTVLGEDKQKFGTVEEQSYIDKVYPKTEKISVDYAILEKAKNVYTISVDIGWSDLGTWNSLHQFLEKDKNNNVIQGSKYIVEDVKESIIKLDRNRSVVINGLEGYIVIDEKDALLIYPKSKEQNIKKVVNKLNN